MLERFQVTVHGGCAGPDQLMEDRLQRKPAAFIARKLDAKRFCGQLKQTRKVA